MNETEITVQCYNQLKDIKKILNNQGWFLKNTYQLNDWYYSAKSIEELNNFSYQDLISNSFLVRQIIENKNENIQLCYKSKILDNYGNVISENKTKTYVNSLANTLANTLSIFDLAKLTMWCKIENTSYVFGKDEIEICIQDISNLGIFIEFEEYEKIKNLSATQKFNEMKNIIQQLNLSLGNDFSCKKVFLKFKQNKKV